MEETLGKRIVTSRKRLGLTQDALAERLGVTAQAVSKWENDQSCPDIAMLPKLAEIFDTTTDALLGVERKEVRVAEIVREEQHGEEPEGLRVQNGLWEFHYDGGRKSSVGFAVWILLVGTILLGTHFNWPHPMTFTLWELLWTSALFVFGLFGLYPKFSIFRLGCAFFGGYFLLEYGGFLRGFNMGMGLILPIVLLLFGLKLLVDALRKPVKGKVSINGKPVGGTFQKYCTYDGETFDCGVSFGEDRHLIQLSRLSGGSANVSFGELTVDLSGCEEIADGCELSLDCSFGELEILVPRKYRAEPTSSTAFASVEVKGHPEPSPAGVIRLSCDASFGEITLRYI